MCDTLPTPSAVRGREWACLAALMIAYSLIFLAYYPPIPGIEDEIGFVNQALVWSRGAISAEEAGFSHLADFVPVAGRHVAARHPGRSLVALPYLLFGGVRATFASGLFLHVAMASIAALVLTRLGRSPLWAVLLLLHPTLAVYSRTIMADAAAGTGLLLAALAVTSTGPLAGVGAGLAVGLAATMRYHAALALPIVAAAFLLPRGRAHAWRDASLCLLAGGIAGSCIAAYNLVVYHAPTEPFTASRGFFSISFLKPHAVYYGSALLVLWPGMLLAPCLDRSSIRWLVRGVCALFLGFLTFYYFHDRGPSWLATVVVGQRLLQVALPLWIVSYAGVVDDWLAKPLVQRVGSQLYGGLVGLSCLVMLGATGLIFDRHQRHLNELLEAKSALVELIPGNSLIAYDGSLTKLIGIPSEIPAYRLRQLTYLDKPAEDPKHLFADLDRERRPWFLAALHKNPGDAMTKFALEIIDRYGLEPLPSGSPILSLYVTPRVADSPPASTEP